MDRTQDSKNRLSRRQFLNTTSASAGMAIAAPMIVPSSVLGLGESTAPSNRITVGMIGVGRQVLASNLKTFVGMEDVEVVALCDADRWRLDVSEERVMKAYGGDYKPGKIADVQRTTDFREVLAREDVDAVMISTPDHWHVPMSVAAVEAGKDVCCEKPLTRSIAEGRLLSDLVTQHDRVFRTDSEFRSIYSFHRACELVRNGYIGELQTIRTGVPIDQFDPPEDAEMPIPEELDYEMWSGPAPLKPYTENRVHMHHGYARPGWMRVRDYCDGMILNWGTHLNDIAQWANDTDRTGPVEVEGHGKYPPKGSLWNVMVEFEVEYLFANGVRMIYKTEKPYVRFEGTEGSLYAEYGKPLEADPPSLLLSKIAEEEIHLRFKPEKRDFIDCVKSRERTLEDAEVGHRTASLGHLGEIAVQVGGQLKWDPDKEKFTNNDRANELLSKPPPRAPWTL